MNKVFIRTRKQTIQSIAEAEAMVNQHPLLCQTDMVQALIDEIKTLTRRTRGLKVINQNPDHYKFIGFRWDYSVAKKRQLWIAQFQEPHGFIHNIPFPYGKVGDILWIRETIGFNYFNGDTVYKAGPYPEHYTPHLHNEDCKFLKNERWSPSIHMEKSFCRLFYKITEVRVERLREISKEDAIAEGIQSWPSLDAFIKETLDKTTNADVRFAMHEWKQMEKFDTPVYNLYIHGIDIPGEMAITDDPRESYIGLFLSINPQKSMNINDPTNNPWVWVIRLQPVPKPENFIL